MTGSTEAEARRRREEDEESFCDDDSIDPRTLGPSAPALLALSDDDAILSADERFNTLFGVPPRIVGKGSVRDLVRWLESEGDAAGIQIAKVIEGGEGLGGEVAAADGRVIGWNSTRLHGSVRGRVFAFRDLGTQRAASRALRDAENWLRMFATHTGGVVLELDSSLRIVGTWSANAEVLARREEEFQGRTLAEVVGEAQAADFEARARDVLATGRPASFEYAFDTGEERKTFAMNASLLSCDGTGPAAVTVLVRDVTEQTRMQTQLVQAERLASVGLLAAGVAHEINNPLTYMLLNLQRVRRGIRTLGAAQENATSAVLASDLEQCVRMMVEGAQRVQEIVQDLQRFSRSDRSETRVEVDVRSILKFTLDMTSFELERRARVVREFGPVPLVLASEGRLSQVFLNLILNAAQAILEPDPHRHEIRIVTATDVRGNAVVEVRDTGVGIPPPDVRKIFDPFFTTKSPGVGTGLGLAICHGITRSLGGDITVDSKVGSGTSFRVVLPAAAGTLEGGA